MPIRTAERMSESRKWRRWSRTRPWSGWEPRLEHTDMDKWLLSIGRLAGVVGVLMVTLAAISRVRGHYDLGGFGVGTLLVAGVAAMVFACLCFLAVLTNASPSRR